jgi:hypothetical protein
VLSLAQSALLRRYRLADAGRLREVPLRLNHRLSRLNKPQVGKQPWGGEEGGLFKAKVVNEKVIIISRRGVALPQVPAVLFQSPADLRDHQKWAAAKRTGSRTKPSRTQARQSWRTEPQRGCETRERAIHTQAGFHRVSRTCSCPHNICHTLNGGQLGPLAAAAQACFLFAKRVSIAAYKKR